MGVLAAKTLPKYKRQAYGVEVTLNYGVRFATAGGGGARQLVARKETILCAGTVHSPYLLMLSGIGPAGHLEEMGIPCALDLSGVGANLQDYTGTGVVCSQRAGPSWEKRTQSVGTVLQESMRPGSTALATTSIQSIAFAMLPTPERRKLGAAISDGTPNSTDDETGDADKSSSSSRPDVQFFYQDCVFPFAPLGSYASFVESVQAGTAPDAFTVHCCLTAPKARGQVRLRKVSPKTNFVEPSIQHNYLSDPRDMAAILEALKMARALTKTEALAGVAVEELLPGPAVQTDLELQQYIRESACHFFGNLVGTCKMGSAGDPSAVVDADCRVIGLDRLRVVDASVIPSLLCGLPNAAVMAVAEKAASLILASSLEAL